ncbi:DUF6941 family protein [Rhizobium mesoamericanum]|uniref:Uncharacterized protein n=1 Tax=Rhizobium mesoamericanum STM3625 TaxID=1211777 RepID=K0PSJ6_9HYPH|nr:hypothetical protein [Rhizobium mesoamericanum]CCM74365.1 hypothetical protein BN77_1488 [Rhizobium mesoamericanum STM3625]
MKVHNLTVCDQVRQEVNGKFILIGVYTNGIVLTQMPGQFVLGVWLLLESDRLGHINFKFRARMAGQDEDLMFIEGQVEVVELENWTPMGFGSPVLIGQSGDLTLEAMFGEEREWTVLRTLRVTKGQVSVQT